MTNTAAPDADRASWLALAAAPTFALMALGSAAAGHEPICGMGASPLGGMTAMYGLMSAFHLTPWLRLRAKREPRQTAGEQS
jgi:hypothetical protein